MQFCRIVFCHSLKKRPAIVLVVTALAFLMKLAVYQPVKAQGDGRFAESSCANPRTSLAYRCTEHLEVLSTQVTFDDGPLTPIYYQWIDGKAIFEGDIILPIDAHGNVFDTDPNGFSAKSAGRALSTKLWPGATVYYSISSSLPNQQRVLDAIAHWEANTRIRFVQRTTQPDYVHFTPSSGCSSYVGRKGGKQNI